MSYRPIDFRCGSTIQGEASVSDDRNVLLLSFRGCYRKGSEGNGDGMFMCAMTAAYCEMVEPASLVLDFTNLEYEWGNTILRTLNFFWEHGRDVDERERLVVIVSTGQTSESLCSLNKTIVAGNRHFTDSLEKGITAAEQAAADYLA